MRPILLQRALALLALLGLVLSAAPAGAIPAFARKYRTACQTCHTIFPKLSPMGEAFRRNGFRFPGIDSDLVNEPQVVLQQEGAGVLPSAVPLAFGFKGHATLHPDRASGGGRADNGTVFTTQGLAAEAELWAGGSFDDRTTFFAELSATAHAAELEEARVLFNDLIGPPHLVNLTVGRAHPNLTSFGASSSYLASRLVVGAPLAGLYGATSDTFRLTDPASGFQLGGVGWGRIAWDVGFAAGPSPDVRPGQSVYAHAGGKWGGLSLDGEGYATAAGDSPPWEERALAIDAFTFRAVSRFVTAAGGVAEDVASGVGAAARAQLDSVELDSGVTYEDHSHAQAGDPSLVDPSGDGARLLVQYNELAYSVRAWLVLAVRIEYLRVMPERLPDASDFRVVPGVAWLVRPNLKATVVAQFELARGAPAAGWGAAGGLAAPTPAQPSVPFENESVLVHLQAAF